MFSLNFHSVDGFSFIFLDLTAPIFAGSPPIVSGDEEVADGQEIVRQFLLGSLRFTLVVDHDFRTVEPAELFDEFKSVPTDPILVGDNNLVDNSLVDSFQKGPKLLPPVVERRPHLLESCVERIVTLEEFHLSSQVKSLFGGTNPGVDVAFPLCKLLVLPRASPRHQRSCISSFPHRRVA